MLYNNILETIGGTPIVRLNSIKGAEAANLFVKVESFNPAGSVKDRPALRMIEDAEARGVIRPGDTIIEPTSGNTGIGLAMVCAVKGYRTIFVMSANMSEERIRILEAFGAELVLTSADKGTVGAIEEAKKIASKKGYFLVGQHFNPANPAAHIETANEIWDDLGDTLGAVICTTGTGGSITGIGHALRKKNPALRIIATEPADSPILSQGIGRPHKIMGTAPAFIPDNLDTSIYDEVVPITTEEAYEMTRLLAEKEGIFAGISSGAAVAGMLYISKRHQLDDAALLAILPDTGERYLSTDVWSKN
ncbi:MAG: cysteine synthase A [Acidiferrobacteraceae bacterium]|nr:cysteine synthase A [Acidiferrobacteraceae bacterium]